MIKDTLREKIIEIVSRAYLTAPEHRLVFGEGQVIAQRIGEQLYYDNHYHEEDYINTFMAEKEKEE